MRKRTLLLFSFLLITTFPACVTYKELMKDWERNDLTPLASSYMRIRPGKEISAGRRDEDFEKQVNKLKEMKEKVLKAVEIPEAKEAFYQPEPERLKELISGKEDISLAQTILEKEFTLRDLEILALLRNPGIRSAERNLKASIEAYSQVSNLDEILRQYAAFTKELMTGVGPMMGAESIEMKFPFPGVLALKGEVVTAEVKASREALEIARRTAITNIRQVYWNLLYIKRAQEITKETLSFLQQLERVAASLYETGKTSFQDLIKVRVEREKLEEELKTMREEQRNLEAKIIEILNLPPGTKLGFPQGQQIKHPVPQLDRLYPLALAKKQELRQMRAMISKMERMIEMAETMIYPPYSLGFSSYSNEMISQTGSMRMKDPFSGKSSAAVSGGLPKMPWYGSNEAYLRETRQKLAALKADFKKMENETIFMVREAWFRLDQAQREEALYAQRVVHLSQTALEVSRRGYETGMVGFAEIIMAYTSWLNDKLTAERKRSDLGITYAQLEEAVGGRWEE